MLKPPVPNFRPDLSSRLKDIAEKQAPAKLKPTVGVDLLTVDEAPLRAERGAVLVLLLQLVNVPPNLLQVRVVVHHDHSQRHGCENSTVVNPCSRSESWPTMITPSGMAAKTAVTVKLYRQSGANR